MYSQVLEATEVPISKRVDPKTMVYLHNGILGSREKEGAYTFCNSMDGTGEHYVKEVFFIVTDVITLNGGWQPEGWHGGAQISPTACIG